MEVRSTRDWSSKEKYKQPVLGVVGLWPQQQVMLGVLGFWPQQDG